MKNHEEVFEVKEPSIFRRARGERFIYNDSRA